MHYYKSYYVSATEARIKQLHTQLKTVQRNMHRNPALRLQAIAINQELNYLYTQW